jgi:hypothetical protein
LEEKFSNVGDKFSKNIGNERLNKSNLKTLNGKHHQQTRPGGRV